MIFEIGDTPEPLPGAPFYSAQDYALGYRVEDPNEAARRRGSGGVTCLALNTVQIDLAIETRLCLWAWGYCPHTSWRRRTLNPPSATRGSLRVISSGSFVVGVSIPIGPSEWRRFFDPDKGWLCLAPDDDLVDGETVEFAHDTIAVVHPNECITLWVRLSGGIQPPKIPA